MFPDTAAKKQITHRTLVTQTLTVFENSMLDRKSSTLSSPLAMTKSSELQTWKKSVSLDRFCKRHLFLFGIFIDFWLLFGFVDLRFLSDFVYFFLSLCFCLSVFLFLSFFCLSLLIISYFADAFDLFWLTRPVKNKRRQNEFYFFKKGGGRKTKEDNEVTKRN